MTAISDGGLWCRLCGHFFPVGTLRIDYTEHATVHGLPNESSIITWEPPSSRNRNTTDLGNAERLIDRHGPDLRFANADWYVWDGRRFRKDDNGAVLRLASETVRSIYTEASEGADERDRKALADHAKRSESASRIQAMVKLAESDERVARRTEDFDKDPLLFTVQNGTIDLRDGTLRAHSREDSITKASTVAFDADAAAPLTSQFLERILPDAEVRAFLWRAVGYSLTGTARDEIMFLLYGTGANGKSTLMEILRALLGEYAVAASSEVLLANRDSTSGEGVARLAGARFVTVDESGAGRRFDAEKVKALTSPGRRAARLLYRNSFEFEVTHKLWFATNHLPDADPDDEALWRRIDPIPFTVTIPEHERDPLLRQKLLRELPGILNLAIAGCIEWQQRGLAEPDAVRNARHGTRRDNDVIGRFLDDETAPDKDGAVLVSRLYERFAAWCDANGEKTVSQKAFSLSVKKRPGIEPWKAPKGGSRLFRGLRLAGDGVELGAQP